MPNPGSERYKARIALLKAAKAVVAMKKMKGYSEDELDRLEVAVKEMAAIESHAKKWLTLGHGYPGDCDGKV